MNLSHTTQVPRSKRRTDHAARDAPARAPRRRAAYRWRRNRLVGYVQQQSRSRSRRAGVPPGSRVTTARTSRRHGLLTIRPTLATLAGALDPLQRDEPCRASRAGPAPRGTRHRPRCARRACARNRVVPSPRARNTERSLAAGFAAAAIERARASDRRRRQAVDACRCCTACRRRGGARRLPSNVSPRP